MRISTGILFLTMTAALAAQVQTYVYKNEFTDPLINNKYVADESKIIKMKDGYMYFEQLKDNVLWVMAERLFVDQEEDYEIEAKIKPYGYGSDAEFGLVFGLKTVETYNNFAMKPVGAVRIGNTALNQYVSFLNWAYKPELVTADRWYVFKIVHKEGRFHFYINNSLIYERKRFDMMGRWFGWYTYGKMGIQIDYYHIRQKRGTIKISGEAADMKKEHLTGGINSDNDESSPVLSKNMKTLYFKREFNDKNDFVLDRGDPVLYACETDSTLKTSFPVKVKMSSGFIAPWYIASVPDEKGFYAGEKKSPAALSVSGISYLQESTGNIDYNRSVKFTGGNTITIRHASISDNGKVMVLEGFSNYEPSGKDLYVSFNQGGSWSQPKKIAALNTKGDENTPFISKDMKKLYFSSDGHPGYGFSDVFVSTRLDDSWMSWSTPENLGKGINDAAYNEAFMMPDTGKFAFMASTSGHINNLDIFRVNIIKPVEEPLVLKGKIIYPDGTPHEIKIVEMVFKAKGLPKEKLEVDKGSDAFTTHLKKDEPFTIRLADTNFIITEQKDLTTIGRKKERLVEVRVARIKRGESFVLENIYFVPNKTELLSASYPSLDQLLGAMRNNSRMKIEVQGHTSKTNEGEAFNTELSSNRANAVKNYLVNNGIPPGRIQAKGYGYSRPLFTDTTEVNQAKNRRVEIRILEK